MPTSTADSARAERGWVRRDAAPRTADSLGAALAHEIRNPLTALIHSLTLLQSRLRPTDSEAELMDVVVDEARRLARMVDGVLQVSRPARDRAPVALEEVTTALVGLLGHREGGRDTAGVAVSAEADLPRVTGEPDRLRQLLWNLLRNAVEAAGPGGRVDVRLRSLREGEREGVLVEVSDSGPGIPPERRERVFDAFETTKPRGTGLGLAIAREVAETHGGRIELADSRLGGARVALWLPQG